MAKRKTVLHIEGVTPEAAPEVPQAANEQVVAANDATPEEAAAPAGQAPGADAAAEAPKAAAAKPAASAAHHKVRAAVSVDAAPAHEEEPQRGPAAEPAPKPKAKPKVAARASAQDAAPAMPREATGKSKVPLKGLAEPVANLVAGHTNAVLGGAVGLVVAVLVFVVGFWQTLFVSALVVVGVAVGQYLDGDPKIINALRRLLAEARGDEQG